MFQEIVLSTPDASAVSGEHGSLTYGELDRAGDAIATSLLALGAGPERVVGVLFERSAEQAAAQLAAWKTGSAFLCLDPALPVARLAATIDDAGVVAVVTDEAGAVLLAGRNIPVVVAESSVTMETGPVHSVVEPNQLAYVIYTSGSTGRPKGVALTHGGLANTVRWQHRDWGIGAGRRCAAVAAPGFDVSVAEIWSVLSAGASIAIPDADTLRSLTGLRDWIVRHEIDVCWVPTSVAEGLVGLPWPSTTALSVLATGGDRLIRRPRPDLPFRLLNTYGPTEASVFATAAVTSADSDGRPPSIGTAIEGTAAYVLDARLRPVGVGETGELCLVGAGVGRGYVGMPGRTAESFVPDPFDPEPGRRMYRTGDVVRLGDDGELDFVGRADRQVKLRGFRIELGEIEHVLASHPSVHAAVVLAQENTNGHKKLVAYLVPAGDAADEPLEAFVRRLLPHYMVPADMVWLDTLPLTTNGKIDREALAVSGAVRPDRDTSPPSTHTEKLVADVWCQVLAVDEVGVHEDFLGIGGESVVAMRIVLALEDMLGRRIPTRMVFEHRTVATFAAWLDDHLTELVPSTPIVPAADDQGLPLSAAQRRLWYFDQLVPNSPLYNAPISITIDGELDPVALEQSINKIVSRHEPLRTHYDEHDGDPVQHRETARPLRLAVVDLRGLAPTERPATAKTAIEADTHAPLDLRSGPMLRALLLHHADDRHELVLTFHHIAFDGWSAGVLLTELGELYSAVTDGRPAALPKLVAGYGDITRWQQERDRGGALDEQLSYWRQRLAALPEPLELPSDRPRPAQRSYRGARWRRPVPAELLAELESVAAKYDSTLFMVLFAAYQVLLHRLTDQDDIVTGVPVTGRDRPESLPLIGFFTNTIPLRIDLSGRPRFTELLGRVREQSLSAFACGEVPLERMVEGLHIQRDTAHTPVFQVMFVMQPPAPVVDAGQLRLELGGEPDNGCAKYDLSMVVDFFAGGPALGAEYSSDLFDAETVARLLERYEALLRGIAADPTQPIWRLPLLGDAEQRLITAYSAGPVVPRPAGVCLHTMVEQQVADTPDAIALEHNGVQLTYAELDRRANQLAHRLRLAGVGPDVPVGLSLERSLDLPIAMLAVFKAGGAFLPVDPGYPTARLAAALKVAKPRVLVTNSVLLPDLPVVDCEVICLDLARQDVAAQPDTAPATGVHPDNLAWIVFTSGSTGQPKGVAMTHAPIVNLMAWQRDDGGLGVPLRTLQFATFGFDISYQEVLTAWVSGSALVMVDDETRRDSAALLDFLDAAGIERLFVPFVALQQLAAQAQDRPTAPARLREIITGGERLQITPEIVGLMSRLPGSVLHNQYGTTETHATTAQLLSGDPAGWPVLPSVGTPIANVSVRILDRDGQPAPIGVVGEIHHGGVSVPRGYFGRSDLTADRFGPDIVDPGVRAYRTGDRARYRADGMIEFVARVDNEVKIRGFRVEPAEIEAVLTRHDTVRDAVVLAVETDQPGERRLVGYLICPDRRLSASDYRSWLTERLPEYMIPAAFVLLDAFPLTPSGKLDRTALPAPAPDELARGGFRPPRTALEQTVAAMFGRVLGIEQIGADDDFFMLGGHSLIGTRIVAALRGVLKLEIALRMLFANSTVTALAEAIRDRHGDSAEVAAAEFLAAELASTVD